MPTTAYTACRLKNRKLEPYWAYDETELAESTITRPSAVSAAVAPISTSTMREWRAASSAGVRSSRFDLTSRRCRGTSITLVAISSPIALVPARSRRR